MDHLITFTEKMLHDPNIIMGILYIIIVIVNTIRESWAFYIFGSVVEFEQLLLIVGYAWKWPKQEA